MILCIIPCFVTPSIRQPGNVFGSISPVIEIKDRAKIYFMLVLILVIPFEFGDIRQPFFIRLICCELPVQDVLSNELGTCCPPGTSVVGILDRGLYPFLPADPQYAFVVYFDTVILLQIILYSAITFIGTFRVDLLNFSGDPFVLCVIGRYTSMEPFVVCGPVHMAQLAKGSDWISVFLMFFFDCLIDVYMPDQAQPRLLSSSSSFFKKDTSISARSFSARRILFSARSLSSSDISSTGFERPRRS